MRRYHARPERGFTLLEVLVVLVIIGILLGLASLSLGDGGREERLRQEASRLAALTELAAQEAILQSREIGLALGESGYRLLYLDGDRWQPLETGGLPSRRVLPEPGRLEASVEDTAVELPPDAPKDRPLIVLASSGELTPFEIRFTEGEGGPAYTVTGDAAGAVTLLSAEPPVGTRR